jgi:hypothetical protein
VTTGASAAVLSASAVVLAVLAILYSLWDADIRTALDTKQGTETLDRQRREIGRACFAKALPLAVYALLSVLIFLPSLLEVLSELWQSLSAGTAAWPRYDASKAALALTWTGTCVLAAVVGSSAWRLFMKWRAWRPQSSKSQDAGG